jgi:hypothetical protein
VIKGKTVGIRLDDKNFDRMEVLVRFTLSTEKDLVAWRDRLGEDQMYEVGDI